MDGPSNFLMVGRAPLTPRTRRPLVICVGLHVILFALLVRGRTPLFVAPASVLGGANGRLLTHLYWATGTDDIDTQSSAPVRGRSKSALLHVTLNKSEIAQLRFDPQSPAASENRTNSDAGGNPAPAAGSAYGSLSEGTTGEEIRPALPAVTSEPLVGPDDLHGITEGNVVIEITIDEAGNIVSKTVVQSMGPAIDARVLAALENWRFRPATRDGVPIPSRQDVVYHFKPR